MIGFPPVFNSGDSYRLLSQVLSVFLFICSDVECLFRVMNDKWLLLKVQLIYYFYLKKCCFLDRNIFWLFWRTFMPLLSLPFSILYSYNEEGLLYLVTVWNVFSCTDVTYQGCFFSMQYLQIKDNKTSLLSIYRQFCVHEYPLPMRQAFCWQVRKYFFLLIWARRN